MRFKRIVSCGLAACLAASSFGFTAFGDEMQEENTYLEAFDEAISCEALETETAEVSEISKAQDVSLATGTAYSDENIIGGSIYFDKSSSAITGCDSIVTSAIIPSEINGVKITVIQAAAFYNCNSLSDVYYGGSEDEWEKTNIMEGNYCLTDATIHYNYYGEPSTEATTETTTEAPTEMTSEPATEEPIIEIALGDVNRDGKINSTDATLILLYAAKLITF